MNKPWTPSNKTDFKYTPSGQTDVRLTWARFSPLWAEKIKLPAAPLPVVWVENLIKDARKK